MVHNCCLRNLMKLMKMIKIDETNKQQIRKRIGTVKAETTTTQLKRKSICLEGTRTKDE